MSRQLPARPNLEHLRKQARARLTALRQHDPSARLADAQHAVAGDYGFASWPKLKAHVERQADAQATASSPFAGEWTADLARSTRHPDNPFRSACIVFQVDGDEVRITDRVVDANAREERHVNTIRADGAEHASAGGHGYSLLARFRDARTLETVGKQNGEVVGSATYAVSTDGRTLTITSDRQVIVLERVGESDVA